MYVILDLHFSAPGALCAESQVAMPDTDNSRAFWKQVATTFKKNPAVLFHMFNEPYSPSSMSGYAASDWSCWLNGCSATQIIGWISSVFSYDYNWNIAGMQSVLDAIRSTGATSVVMAGGLEESTEFSLWLKNKPVDTLSPPQLAASWHSYSLPADQQ